MSGEKRAAVPVVFDAKKARLAFLEGEVVELRRKLAAAEALAEKLAKLAQRDGW